MRLFLLPLLFAATTLFAIDPAERSVGSPNAPLTLEVYSDFQCPHCARLHFGAIKMALSDCIASGKVRIVYRDFPLPQHPYARKAAQLADAASRIGRYERVCDTLFRTQEQWGRTGDIEGAIGRELSPEEWTKIHKILSDPKAMAEINREIDADLALGTKVPLTETPTMILSGKGRKYPVIGDVSYDRLKILVDGLMVK
jgi:protein-disulfide isomerase